MRFVLLLTFLLAGPAFAESGVLLNTVPVSAPTERVIAIMRQAFIGRKWNIESEDTNSVTGTIVHDRITARLRLVLSGPVITYEQEVKGAVIPTNPAGAPVGIRNTAQAISRWRRNIEHDIRTGLAGLPRS